MNDKSAEVPDHKTCDICNVRSVLIDCFIGLPRSGYTSVCPQCVVDQQTKEGYRWMTAIAVMIAFGLAVALSDPSRSSWVIVNLAVFIVMLGLLVIPHELGHAIAGKLVGINPYQIVVGTGRKFYSFNLFDLYIDIQVFPYGGITFSEINIRRFARLRYAIYVSGGILVHVLLIALSIWIVDHFNLDESFSNGPAPFMSFIAANVLLAVGNLVPGEATMWGQKMKRDGALLLEAILGRRLDFEAGFNASRAHRIACATIRGDNDRAIRWVDEFVKQDVELTKEQRVTLSAAYINGDRPEEGAAFLQEMIVDSEPVSLLKAVACNNVAWANLLSRENGKGLQALILSRLAAQLMPWEVSVLNTLGSAEALFGDPDRAVEILMGKRVQAKQNRNKATAMAALAIAYSRLNRQAESQAAIRNSERLDEKSKMLSIARQVCAGAT